MDVRTVATTLPEPAACATLPPLEAFGPSLPVLFTANGEDQMCVTRQQYFNLMEMLAREVEWAKAARAQYDHYRGCQP